MITLLNVLYLLDRQYTLAEREREREKFYRQAVCVVSVTSDCADAGGQGSAVTPGMLTADWGHHCGSIW